MCSLGSGICRAEPLCTPARDDMHARARACTQISSKASFHVHGYRAQRHHPRVSACIQIRRMAPTPTCKDTWGTAPPHLIRTPNRAHRPTHIYRAGGGTFRDQFPGKIFDFPPPEMITTAVPAGPAPSHVHRYPARDIRRIESVSKSPLLSHLTESVTGLDTVLVFGADRRFLRKNLELVGDVAQAFYTYWATTGCFTVYLEVSAQSQRHMGQGQG